MDAAHETIDGYSLRNRLHDRGWCDSWLAESPADGGRVEILLAHQDADAGRVAHGMLALTRIAKAEAKGAQRILSVSPSGGRPFAVLEARRGTSLEEIVSTRGPLSGEDVANLALHIGQTMLALNTSCEVALRSIKPGNVMLDDQGGITLCDFSQVIFPAMPGHGASIDGDAIVGTPQYLSPEQAAASENIRFSSDLYALGATLYFAATGVVPFGDRDPMEVLDLQQSATLSNPSAINGTLGVGICRLIRILMMKNPAHRYKDWQSFVDDAETVAFGGQPAFAPPAGAASTVEPLSGDKAAGKPIVKKIVANNEEAAAPTPAKGKSPSGAVRFVLWLLLIAWLAVLGNFRIGNPLHLPMPHVTFEKSQ